MQQRYALFGQGMDGGKYHFQAAHQFFSRRREELTRIRTEQRGLKRNCGAALGQGELFYNVNVI